MPLRLPVVISRRCRWNLRFAGASRLASPPHRLTSRHSLDRDLLPAFRTRAGSRSEGCACEAGVYEGGIARKRGARRYRHRRWPVASHRAPTGLAIVSICMLVAAASNYIPSDSNGLVHPARSRGPSHQKEISERAFAVASGTVFPSPKLGGTGSGCQNLWKILFPMEEGGMKQA